MSEYELLKAMYDIMMKNEWQIRGVVENLYCPFCAKESDRYEDQYQHYEGCEFEKIRKEAEGYLYLSWLNEPNG